MGPRDRACGKRGIGGRASDDDLGAIERQARDLSPLQIAEIARGAQHRRAAGNVEPAQNAPAILDAGGHKRGAVQHHPRRPIGARRAEIGGEGRGDLALGVRRAKCLDIAVKIAKITCARQRRLGASSHIDGPICAERQMTGLVRLTRAAPLGPLLLAFCVEDCNKTICLRRKGSGGSGVQSSIRRARQHALDGPGDRHRPVGRNCQPQARGGGRSAQGSLKDQFSG